MAHSHSILDNPVQLTSIILGAALIGGLSAILFAPSSGRQARQEIKTRTNDFKNKIRDKAQSINNDESAQNIQDTMTDTMDSVEQKMEDTASSSKRTMSRKAIANEEDETDHIRKHGER